MALYLAQKKVDVATSGTTPFAWPTLLDGKNPTLLGYKVRLASAIADKAAGAKVLAFGNPAHYVIGGARPDEGSRSYSSRSTRPRSASRSVSTPSRSTPTRSSSWRSTRRRPTCSSAGR